ncbi:MAG: FtsW/RodA/SpoVE family cell cycle protein [Bacteroidetes bacterium]|nr:FtsW/RodA/SpoVE family cell cycle protein [Bacteroidota bacterium]HNR18351.1 FtsW/RodA/SpoVE family cell cycle protein [Bacteroidia bacterium]HNU32329.1 FtsW/RodA/SpoVE family cell cycle protein [Bacteroidia bacterium]
MIDTYFKGDRIIWLVVMLLSIVSILAVYSSTGTLAYKYQSGNTEYYLFKHGSIILFGFLIMYLAHKVKYTFYARISKIAVILVLPLLLLTLLMGANLNDASRWLRLPVIGLSFQTSDLAKVALIIFVARMLAKNQDKIKDFKTGFLPIIIPVVLVCGLILPANFSTAAVLFSTCLVLMFIGRVSAKYILSLMGIGVVGLGLFIGIALMVGYEGRIKTWQKRIENFSNPESEANYQTQQAKIAIAKGGLLGQGPGNSTQRNFLPHPYSDFIYAIILEEYGLAGGMFVLMLYLLLLYRAVLIVRRSPKAFATMLAIGCAFSLVFQAMINMAVAVNLFPVTGQPLPMLSMGGTSIWFTSIALGIILSVSRDVEGETQEEGGMQLAAA